MKKISPSHNRLFLTEKEVQSFRLSDRSTMSLREKSEISCAFHLHEKITNFCKDPTCLLPLCPKCIKIHSEQHAQQGTFSSFQSIEDCLQQAHQTYLALFSDVSRLQRKSFEIEEAYKKKKQQTMCGFKKSKQLALDYLNGIFNQYQEALKLQLAKDQRLFTQQLIIYHDYIGKVMEKCRNGTKKFNNKHLLMEGLINFYSETHIREQLQECEQNLNNYTIKNIQIRTNDEVLQDFKPVIKKYFKFGEDEENLEILLAENSMYKQTNLNGKNNNFYGQIESPRSYSLIGSLMKNSVKGIQSMESPLDKYSLERSRNIRNRVSQKKNFP